MCIDRVAHKVFGSGVDVDVRVLVPAILIAVVVEVWVTVGVRRTKVWQTSEMTLLAKRENTGGSLNLAAPTTGAAVRRTRIPSVEVTVTVTVGFVVACEGDPGQKQYRPSIAGNVRSRRLSTPKSTKSLW